MQISHTYLYLTSMIAHYYRPALLSVWPLARSPICVRLASMVDRAQMGPIAKVTPDRISNHKEDGTTNEITQQCDNGLGLNRTGSKRFGLSVKVKIAGDIWMGSYGWNGQLWFSRFESADNAISKRWEGLKSKFSQGLRPWTPWGSLQRPQTPQLQKRPLRGRIAFRAIFTFQVWVVLKFS